jgi:hypothetical protein
MSEMSDQAESPTAFIFENLHDVEELFEFDDIAASTKREDAAPDVRAQAAEVGETASRDLSPEIIEIEAESKRAADRSEKSVDKSSVDKNSSAVDEDRQPTIDRSESASKVGRKSAAGTSASSVSDDDDDVIPQKWHETPKPRYRYLLSDARPKNAFINPPPQKMEII